MSMADEMRKQQRMLDGILEMTRRIAPLTSPADRRALATDARETAKVVGEMAAKFSLLAVELEEMGVD
jgi:hypothetical protein